MAVTATQWPQAESWPTSPHSQQPAQASLRLSATEAGTPQGLLHATTLRPRLPTPQPVPLMASGPPGHHGGPCKEPAWSWGHSGVCDQAPVQVGRQVTVSQNQDGGPWDASSGEQHLLTGA